jgi:O-methyltransferase domain/Dimerisation domain
MSALLPIADVVERPIVSPSVDIGSSCTLLIGSQRDTSSMSDIAHAKTETQSPQGQLIQMATAHWVSRFLYVAARMNLADQLAERSKTAEELAQSMGTAVSSLYRFMRTLASLGIFTEDSGHRFSLTRLGEALRTGTPGSVRASVLTLAGEIFTQALDHLHYSVQTGKTSFDKVFGVPLFDWLANHPAEASMFSETMVGLHGAEPPAVAAAYDFSEFATVIDVGGATGNLLTTILGRYPMPRGILFDLPHVVADAPELISERGLVNRIKIESGSFFENVPSGGDVYLLSHIIHDWSEAQCLAILRNCRRAMQSDSRLLLIEMVLPTGNAPHLGKMLDIIMLAIPGGQERTEPEYRALLDKAGFRLKQVVPTESAVSVVEAVLA